MWVLINLYLKCDCNALLYSFPHICSRIQNFLMNVCLKIQFWCENLLTISIEYQSKSFSEFREQLRKQSVDEVRDEIAKSGKGKKRSKSVAVQGDSGSDNALNLEEFRKFFKILLKMEEIEKLFYKCALCLRSPTRTI